MSFLTYQDFEQASDKRAFIQTLIGNHKGSRLFQTAIDADRYDRQQNTAIMDFTRKLFMQDGSQINDPTSTFTPIPSNYFRRLNVQRNMYSLGNGISFDDDKLKDKLGGNIDTQLQRAGYYALIHGLSFVMWDVDKTFIIPVTEFAPLWDEYTSALRAGVRFWQLAPDKPLIAVLYEEDGYTEYRSRKSGALELHADKQPYKLRVERSAALGETITGGENYSALPIVPMWGSKLRQSTLIGMKPSIDAYDLINSGFADTVSQCAQVYWIIDNVGGMEEADYNAFRKNLLFRRVASVDADSGVRVTPYTQEIPHAANEAALAQLRQSIYEDYGGLDVSNISSAAKTATEINAAYQPLDENADDYEYQIIETVRGLLALQGLDGTPIFKRNRIANQSEQTTMVITAAQYLDEQAVLEHLPWLTPDETDDILKRTAAEDMSRFGNAIGFDGGAE